MSEEKICPECAEAVKSDAKVCKHCGHRFEGGAAQPDETNAKAASGAKKMGIGCVILIGFFLVIALMFGSGDDDSAVVADGAPNADTLALAVTAQELASAYEANEAAAQQQYGGQPLEVTGTIAGITLDFSDDPVVQLSGTNEFLDVQASLAEGSKSKAGNLSKGQQITLRCESVTEVISAPMLSECSF